MKRLLLWRPVASFFILTLAWSAFIWSFLLPHLHLQHTDWFWLGECAPGLAAIFLTWIDQKGHGIIQLIKPIFYWRVNPFYYYLVIILTAFFYLAAIGMTALQGMHVPTIASLYPTKYFGFAGIKLYGLWMVPLLTVLYFFCEELGWRGYALSKLIQRHDAFTASIIIGIAWAVFHIPLMKLSVFAAHPAYFALYIFYTILDSVFLSWLYLNTGGSLLLVSISHAICDTYGSFSPTIISSLGQGERGTVILMKLIIYLPIIVLLYKQKKVF